MRLWMLSKEYPSAGNPVYSFVEQLARGFAGAGVDVTVVAPLSLTRLLRHKKRLPQRVWREAFEGGGSLTVLRPLTLSFSSFKGFGLNAPKLNQHLFLGAVKNALRGRERPEAIYGHFISLAGTSAGQLGRQLGVPAFLGYGESSPLLYKDYDRDFLKEALHDLSGVVAVSGENRRELLNEGLLPEGIPIGVFPNGCDGELFYPRDRAAARKKLGFAQDAFIVSFVGAFSERKGVGVLSAALRSLPGVMSLFVGRGALLPDCPGVQFLGPLDHGQIPDYLAASDAFVLPTLAEGCCNAIVEALAMGLPVISSDLPFNDDILSAANSLRVDPLDADAVADAIARLRDDLPLRARLAQGARESGRELEIKRRVQTILRFIQTDAKRRGSPFKNERNGGNS